MNTLYTVLCALLISTLPSCSSTTLLNATFEEDTPGAPPNSDLPGDPAGDIITHVPDLYPQLVVNPGITTGKALHFTAASVPFVGAHGPGGVNFRSTGASSSNTVWIIYSSRKSENTTLPVFIDITDGNAHSIARMRIAPFGEVKLARNILDNFTDIIGNVYEVRNTGHTVVFTLNMANLIYNVTIFNDQGGPTITAANKPMITRNASEFSSPVHPTITFSYLNTHEFFNPLQAYIIEGVKITRRIPDIMR